MNLKSDKGFTGVDISVALIIIVLFVSIIATLIYNFGITSKAVNRKAIATDIAISKIEEIKQKNYDEITSQEETAGDNREYTVKTEVTNYKNSEYVNNLSQAEKDNLQDIIKIVKVTVEFTVGTDTENVDISTVITKEI